MNRNNILDSCLKVHPFINNHALPCQSYTTIYDPGKLTNIVGKAGVSTPEDVDQAVKAAHQGFLSWGKLEPQERVEKVMLASDVLENSISDLAHLLVREHGGLLQEAKMDFRGGYGNFKYYENIVEEFMEAEEKEDEKSWIRIENKPKGVVAAIVPWNMPVVLTMMKLVPALMTGNTIVVKPSPRAPLALTLLLQRMAAVLPNGVINVVLGDDDVGAALTSHPLVKKVAFTGGCENGKKVMVNAASSLKGVTLELGGNDPAIILDDAPIEELMPRLVKGIFTRAGQICYAIKRLYVPQAMLKDFFDLMCEHLKDYRVGHGLDEHATMGPVNNLEQFRFVRELINEAKENGAVVRELGSKCDPDNWDNGYYILPHVVIDKEHTTRLVHCEQFGPVIPITPYETIEEAIAMANDSNYGLASSIWTGDYERGKKLAPQLEAGLTFINVHGLGSTAMGMPFGGIKDSGVGREMSAEPTLYAYTDFHAMRLLK
ncbi:MAG: aldehyde dehydrogenase family protein [Desulfitobacterium sp.]|nr:aldehyde dehydrogenase family protein [Desulfitobacterium sp.]